MRPSTSSRNSGDPKMRSSDKETSTKGNPRKEHLTENSDSEDEPQKPDKIPPCPRCNGIDTKFCYNDYNSNQPRHFCDHCQRYWTAQGTSRDTHVGCGRRKNKSSSLAYHCRHIVVSKDVQGAHHHIPLSETRCSDTPLYESINSAPSVSEKGLNDDSDNFQGYPLQEPCFPAPPWPSMAPPTSLGPSAFPVSFYPTSQYWDSTVQPSPWIMQANPAAMSRSLHFQETWQL